MTLSFVSGAFFGFVCVFNATLLTCLKRYGPIFTEKAFVCFAEKVDWREIDVLFVVSLNCFCKRCTCHLTVSALY